MNPVTSLALTLALAAFSGDFDNSKEEFQKRHADLLKPEKWETVPWKSNLIEARDLAFKERKPLFLWCMDAKPLGSV